MKHLGKLITLILISSSIYAREYRVSSQSHFFSALRRNELVIALFYEEAKDHRHRETARHAKILKDNFRAASKHEPYVAFILVNVAKDELDQLASKFHVNSFPTYMLFRRGRPYSMSKKGADGAVVKTSGELTQQSIINFVEDHFKDYIDDILEFKREEAERRAEQAQINALSWGPYYWGWGYPYYWYPYYGYYWGRRW